MSNIGKTRTDYCPNCEEERELRVSVEWQPDVCTVCDADVETA